MRFQFIVSVVLGAASFCGCIQANPADGERVEAAEQPIFVDPPTPHGFLFLGDGALLFRARPLHPPPALAAAVIDADLAAASDDDDDDDGGGDPE